MQILRSQKCAIVLAMTLLCVFHTSAPAQEAPPYAKAVLDTNAIVIGQQVKMQLEVTVKNNEKITWIFPETLAEGVEVVSRTPIDTAFEDRQQIFKQTLFVTSFDSGFYALEPLRFPYHVEGDTTTYYTQIPSAWLEVTTVAVDTTKSFFDIKPLMPEPLTWREIMTYVVWILGGLIVLCGIAWLILLLIRKYRKKRPDVVIAPPKPKIPPYITALEELEALRLKKLWQSDKIKEYYSELTDIVREYIEAQFGVQAVEMTTDEILFGLKNAGINAQAMGKLSGTLQTADLVKFAKAQPHALENDAALTYSVDFVKETHKYEEQQNNVENQQLRYSQNDVIASAAKQSSNNDVIPAKAGIPQSTDMNQRIAGQARNDDSGRNDGLTHNDNGLLHSVRNDGKTSDEQQEPKM
ncbi:MAG: hypothetical protein FWG84_07120 [Bacteroidales bacterium]|nr:hypothetical protein [Bacteroidales bacterium]